MLGLVMISRTNLVHRACPAPTRSSFFMFLSFCLKNRKKAGSRRDRMILTPSLIPPHKEQRQNEVEDEYGPGDTVK